MIFLKNGPTSRQKFQNRQEAGEVLVQKLKRTKLGSSSSLIVCAIPRGGVIVGAILAKSLGAKLTALPIKKIPAPTNPELAIGAVGTWGAPLFDRPLIAALQISQKFLAEQVKVAKAEVARREIEYGIGRRPSFSQKTVILTDDGVATGATINLAAKLIKSLKPKKLILAVPVAPVSKIPEFEKKFDKVLVLLTPSDFTAVGQFYYDFPQVTDEEVKQLLAYANR